MEIILKQDVPNLGDTGEIVSVKPGYARNFLIPKGYAIIATESNRKVVAENLKQAKHKLERVKNEALEKAARLEKESIKIPVKVGTTGKLFGSITTLQVSRALKDLGYEIDRKVISFPDEIKEIGNYRIVVKLHREVSVDIPLDVTPDEEQ
jgi:large subunit ribosomal protein L9